MAKKDNEKETSVSKEILASRGENARVHEQTARAEIIQRIALRDNALVLYIGAIGAIIGLVGSGNIGLEILLIVPYLAFGAAIIINQHNVLIGLLGHYLVVELDTEYKKLDEYVPQWDGSKSATTTIGKYPVLLQLKYGHLVLIATPPILGLILNWRFLYPTTLLAIAWWLGVVLTLLSVGIILGAARYRNELYTHYPKK